jgi:hypothetical protein
MFILLSVASSRIVASAANSAIGRRRSVRGSMTANVVEVERADFARSGDLDLLVG